STPKQARQFVVHGHIYVAGGRVTVPSYIVQSDEENKITSSAPKIKAKEK
ncbi:MAG: S4 domain-containing protein, partial [Candidatus Hydrothermarchaeaceae archaeon]